MSLKAWYPFDGNIRNYGPGKLSLTQGVAPTYVDGKVTEKALSTGSFSWTADQAASILNNKEITIAFWYKALNTSSGGAIFGTESMPPPNNRRFTIFAYPTANDLHWSWQNYNSSNTFTGGSISGAMPVDEWVHICFTYNNPKGCVYINGELKREFSGVSNSPSFAYATTVIHNRTNRHIQDFRVYDNCLTPREVKQIAQGLAAHYKMNGNNHSNMLINSYKLNGKSTGIDSILHCPIISADNSAGTSYKDFISWSGITVNANEVYTVSFYAKSVTSSTLTMYFYNNASGIVQVSNIKSSEGHNKSGSDGSCPLTLTPQWKKYWVTWTFNATTTAADKTLLFRLAAGGKCEMALPKLERGAIATPYGLTLSESKVNLAEDSSGYRHHGTVIGDLTLSSDSRRYSNSCVFDGTTTGLNLPIKNLMKQLLNDKCSINFWVNEADTSSRSIYFGGYKGSNFNIEMSGGKLRVYWNGSPDIQTSSVVNNTWTMFTITIDKATGIKIYKDSALVYTHDAALSDIASAFTRDFNIGKDSRNDATMMEGKMSDFRIYASVLSQEDINILYKSSIALIENGQMQAYEFNEEPDTFNIKMHQTGSIETSNVSEVGYSGGMKIKVLPDRSAWARIHWLDVTTENVYFANNDEVAFCNKLNRFSRMGLVDYFKSYSLPKEYTKLDYIESTGTQFIDTGYYWTSEAVKIHMDATVESNSASQSLFGNEEPFSGGRYFSIVPHGANGKYSFYVGSSSNIATASTTVGERFVMECETTAAKALTVKVNGTAAFTKTYAGTVMGYANTTSTHTSKGKIYIFANHNSGSGGAAAIQHIGGMKLYAFKMYDNGVLVRDFIPCKNSAGAIGLLDKVHEVFYSNAGSGVFTAGPIAADLNTETGVYEFMLTYPRISATGYNRWIQTSSPNEATVTGFKSITETWEKAHSGLRKHGSACVYNCDSGGSWYAPIGQKSQWTTGKYIPAANETSTTETELWVRIDNLPKLNKISMLENEFIQAVEIKEN